MSTKLWPDHLSQLSQILNPPGDRRVRVAILGIGNELHGDDAAGILAARILLSALSAREHLLIIEAGTAPENCTGALRAFRPDWVLLIDAAQMGELPGTVRWLAWQETSGVSASTHTLPLHMLSLYLHEELGCAIALIGIQPAGNTMFAPLSDVVREAVDWVVEEFVDGSGKEDT